MATTNQAKVDQIAGALADIGVTVIGVKDRSQLPEVAENGKTALENAKKKALAFANALDRVVLSMDNTLYFDALKDDPRQPGLNVRRFAGEGRKPTDEGIIDYYSRLVKELGGNAAARWEYGVCIAAPDGRSKGATIGYQTVFVDTPSQVVLSGYPLESLQKDPDSGRYRSEMGKEELATLWQKKIGRPLSLFVSTVDF